MPRTVRSEAAAPEPPRPALRLQYATPTPRRWRRLNALLLLCVRKLVFAGGVGLVAWGCASISVGLDRPSSRGVIACGAALAGLMLPFPMRNPVNEEEECRCCRVCGRRCGI
jgi:hypothetical protein